MATFGEAVATSHVLSLMAMEEASRQGLREADCEHLLIALALDGGVAGQVLRSLGVTVENTRAALSAQHTAQLESLGVEAPAVEPGRIVFHETQGYHWSGRALQVMKDASRAGRDGDAPAILRALVAEPSGFIAATLERLGTDADEVARRLDDADRLPSAPRRRRDQARLSTSTTAFVPAPPEQVWALVSDAERIPEWDAVIGSVTRPHGGAGGDVWIGRPRTHAPDGRPLRITPAMRQQEVHLVSAQEPLSVQWRFRYPDVARSNARRVTLTLEHAAGGTHLGIALAWEPPAGRRPRPLAALVLRPLYRVMLGMQVSLLSAAISRVFRE